MRLLSCFIMVLMLIGGLSSCNGKKGQGEEQISTEVITNPKSASGTADLSNLPKIEFEAETHDFGKVIEGEIVSYAFKFKNSGASDLIISAVSTSCGCTASEYPEEPVKPGEEGTVKIRFNSSRRKGFQNKTATVLANTQPNKTQLRIKAMVINPEKESI